MFDERLNRDLAELGDDKDTVILASGEWICLLCRGERGLSICERSSASSFGALRGLSFICTW